jgi:uncharacterized protein YjbI with pentapeptide repeats
LLEIDRSRHLDIVGYYREELVRMNLKVEQLQVEMADMSGSTFQKVKAEELRFDNVNLAKSQIHNANMSGMILNDVNMAGVTISDVNLSHAVIDHVHLFGTEFRNVVLPKEGDGNYNPDGEYKPIRFDNCNLSDARITGCNLSNLDISGCNISGLKINGIRIEELIRNAGERNG